MSVPFKGTRRGFALATATTGACSLLFTGLAPAAAAEDMRSKQEYLDSMQAERMWKVSTGKGVKVAVIDTGVKSDTPSLKGQVLEGTDLSGLPHGADHDYSGHGTTMAELIAGTGRNGGLRGLAPDAKIIPIRASLTDDAVKEKKVTTPKAIREAADSDARIINVSFGGRIADPEAEKAVKYAQKKGKLIFAGSGNEAKSGNYEIFPAGFSEVVSVGSVDNSGKVSDTSSYATPVILSAPGRDVPSWCDEEFKSYCDHDGGTSAATAITSAAAALIWSKNPDWTANQVLRVLIQNAREDMKDERPSKYIGYGIVKPRLNLLDDKGDPGPPDEFPLTANGTYKPASSSSSPSPGEKSKGGGSSDEDSEPEEARAADSASDEASEEEGSQVWPVLGAVGAGVLVLAGAGAVLMRMRRG